MRKITLLLLFPLLLNNSLANSSTSEETENLSKIDRIYYTCKIWGMLKYYHPLIAKGSFDWDAKMLSVLNSTAKIQNYEAFSEYMANWIYYMGPIKPCTTCKSTTNEQSFLKNFDLSWTQDKRFSDKLRSSLRNIENNRFQGNHNYIGQGSLGEFEPKNEETPPNYNWKDENHRLLPLFRFWNYIEYFYPYKYLTEQSWDDVLKEMIPKFLAAETKLDYHLAMLELIVKIDDSHAGLITPVLDAMPYYNYLPAKFELVENQVVITEIIDAEKSQSEGLQVGDIITSVNNQSAISLHKSHLNYIWGSNEAVKNRSIYHTLFMGMQSPVEVTIKRNGAARKSQLNLYKYSDISYAKGKPKSKWENIGDSIGYVNLGELAIADVKPMMDEFMDKTAIIFDVRNNPRGTYKAIADYLLPNDTVFTLYTKPDYSYPGKFKWEGDSRCGKDNPDYFKGLVILLVNENTQSHAEYTCMCLQNAPRVVTIGSQTAGTDGKVTKFPILDNLYTAMTGVGVYYPNRGETQRVGIVPDVNVTPTLNGLSSNQDEQLEKAIEVAREEVAREIAKAKEALLKAAMDSLMMDSTQVDSLQFMIPGDSLKIENDGRNR